MKILDMDSFISTVKMVAKTPKKFQKLLLKRWNKKEQVSRAALQRTESDCPSYEDIFDDPDPGHSSDISPNDSGVILYKDVPVSQQPKVEDPEPPSYVYPYSMSTPRLSPMKPPRSKVVTRAIVEQPHNDTLPLKTPAVENGHKNTDEKTHCIGSECEIVEASNSEENNNFVRSVDEKFVVNIFESRKSNRWKRRSSFSKHFHSIKIIKDEQTRDVSQEPELDNHEINYSSPWQEVDGEVMFHRLKTMRDVECVKMNQASNALKAIRKRSKRELSEELLIEKILLESALKYKLIVNKIRDLIHSEPIPSRTKHTGSISLSNCRFDLKPQPSKDSEYASFYILALTHGIDLLVTKVTSPSEDRLLFDETFTLRNIDEDFQVKAEVFRIKLKTAKPRLVTTLMRRKSKDLCPTSTIYYENVHTYEAQESAILNPAFISCGSFTITKEQIGSSSFLITELPELSPLNSKVDAIFSIADLNLNLNLSGFLNLGRPDDQNNIVFWETKWCSLKNTQLALYNYPQEEEYEKPPLVTISLEYCFVPIITKQSNCPRKKSFVLKTGRPSTVNDSNIRTLRRRPNFVLEKYYFAADSTEDFQMWTEELNSALECLRDWRKLVFLDDYYL